MAWCFIQTLTMASVADSGSDPIDDNRQTPVQLDNIPENFNHKTKEFNNRQLDHIPEIFKRKTKEFNKEQ